MKPPGHLRLWALVAALPALLGAAEAAKDADVVTLPAFSTRATPDGDFYLSVVEKDGRQVLALKADRGDPSTARYIKYRGRGLKDGDIIVRAGGQDVPEAPEEAVRIFTRAFHEGPPKDVFVTEVEVGRPDEKTPRKILVTEISAKRSTQPPPPFKSGKR